MELMKQYRRGMFCLLMFALALPVRAHHSSAMFDHDKQVTLLGTVKTFEWTNPHCWIQLLVHNPDGSDVEWGIELLSPRLLVRAGWKVGDVKVGDKIMMVVHPKRDGTAAGGYVSGVGADGQPLKANGVFSANAKQ
jgi:hypothetical protein